MLRTPRAQENIWFTKTKLFKTKYTKDNLPKLIADINSQNEVRIQKLREMRQNLLKAEMNWSGALYRLFFYNQFILAKKHNAIKYQPLKNWIDERIWTAICSDTKSMPFFSNFKHLQNFNISSPPHMFPRYSSPIGSNFLD